MMDRRQEYWAMAADLQETPPALDGSVERALTRRKRLRARRWLGIPVATLGGIASAFVLLVNISLPFAMACRDVPFLRRMAAAVAFSPSLKAAVENDYYQYVGQSRTDNGITMTVHYLILDPSQINVYFTLEGGTAEEYWLERDMENNDDLSMTNAIGSGHFSDEEEMGVVQLSFTADETLPELLPLRLQARPAGRDPGRAPTASGPWDFGGGGEYEPVARFAFDLRLDPRFTAPAERLKVDKWMDLDGQRILVESIDVFPLSARLNLGEDDSNTAWLHSLDFYLEDGAGNRFERQGGISSLGDSGSLSRLAYFVGSPHFSGGEGLALHVTGAGWLDKDRRYATLDLKTGRADGLPPGAEVETVERAGDDVRLSVRYRSKMHPLVGWDYYDPEGGTHHRSGGGTTTNFEDAIDYLTLEDYPWDTVRLTLNFSRSSVFESPIAVGLT